MNKKNKGESRWQGNERLILIIVIIILLISFNVSIAQDSLYVFNADTLYFATFNPSVLELEINYAGFISIIDSSNRKLVIDFTQDTVKCEGFVLDSHAETFCWAIIKVMQDQYSDQWKKIIYLENKYLEYRAALEPKYLKALELYIQQNIKEENE